MDVLIGLVGGLALGIPLTLGGTYYLFVLQRERKELGWELISSTPIVTKPSSEPDIKIAVNSRLLNSSSTDDWTDIEEFRAFRVRLRNTGNKVLEDISASFKLGGEARVVALEGESVPDFGARSLTSHIQVPSPQSARAVIPFLNSKQETILSLKAVNSHLANLEISAGAPGLIFYDLARRSFWKKLIPSAGVFLASIAYLLPLGVLEAVGVTNVVTSTEENAWEAVATGLMFVATLSGLLAIYAWASEDERHKRLRG